MADKLYSSTMLQQVAGCSRKALRVYQDRGLITPVRKTGNRRYDAEALSRLRFIVALRKLGVPIKEISALLPVREGQAPSGPVAGVLSHKVADLVRQVSDQIELMRDLRNQLIVARETLMQCTECTQTLQACRTCADSGAIDPVTQVLLATSAPHSDAPQ